MNSVPLGKVPPSKVPPNKIIATGGRVFSKRTARGLLCGLALGIGLVGLSTTLAQSKVRFFGYTAATDPLTDGDRSMLTTLELDQPGGREGILQLRCQGNSSSGKTELYVALQHDLGLSERDADSKVYWQFRFDKSAASPEWLSYLSRDARRIYLTDEARYSFVQGLRSAKQLAVVVALENGEPQTFRFNVVNPEAALKKLKCSAPKPQS